MKPISCGKPISDENPPILRVQGLDVGYTSGDFSYPVLLDVDFDMAPGEVLGILGESGCGKSTLALSLLRLLPDTALVKGSILFRNQDLLSLTEPQLGAIRGARISLIHQEPGLSLSPVMRVGGQIAEVIRAHRHLKRSERKREVEAILKDVQLLDVDRIYVAYPHQLSGGELHRVAIAQALACRPELVIADEPTRSLDMTVQAEIMSVLRELNRRFGTALLFITHNPALLVGFADRVIVMYAGRMVEKGPLAQVFRRPLHPYTRGLLQLIPRSLPDDALTAERHLPVIPGSPPGLKYLSCGCAFEPRCSRRTPICGSESPEEITPEEDHRVSCFNHGN